MPLARYFAFVGGLLLALLFLADWYFPTPAAAPATTGVDKTIIRLHSAHRWPESIVFDTSLPTIVPPSALAAVERLSPAAPAPSPKQAFALVLPEATPVRADPSSVPRKRIHRPRTRTAAGNARRMASDETGFRTWPPAGW
jgi:hypothetical protein